MRWSVASTSDGVSHDTGAHEIEEKLRVALVRSPDLLDCATRAFHTHSYVLADPCSPLGALPLEVLIDRSCLRIEQRKLRKTLPDTSVRADEHTW